MKFWQALKEVYENNMNKEWEIYEEPEKTYTFMEVVKGLREGKKFRRKSSDWPEEMELGLYLIHPSITSEEIFGMTLSEMTIEDKDRF